jgi:hypothetical protein
MNKFKIKDADHPDPSQWLHSNIIIVGQEATHYCGDSHCKGSCGFPALMLAHPLYGEFKAHSSMVACGPVFQKKPWDGSKVQILDLIPDLDPETCLKMMWW